MKLKIGLWFGFLLFVTLTSLHAQAIEPRDCAEIRKQATETLERFALLLNQVADPLFYPSERDELIKNSFKASNPGRVFYNGKVIVENDLNPTGSVVQNTGLNDKTVEQYLHEVDLLYSKSDTESVFFSNLYYGPIREKDYVFIQILYNSEYKGFLKDEPDQVLPRHKRVVTIRAEKVKGQWRAYILQVNFFRPDYQFIVDHQDEDCDGISDPEDNCPKEAGSREWGGCPPPPDPDLDRDGIVDSTDECPEQMGPWCAGGCPMRTGQRKNQKEVLWQELLGNTGRDVAFDITKNEKGELIFAGETEVPGKGKDLYMAIFDPCRKYLSNRLVVGGAQQDGARKVIQLAPGQYALAGYTESSGSGSRDAWYLLTDGTQKTAEKFFGTARSSEAFSDLAKDAQGNLLFSGEKDGKIWLLQTDLEGRVLKETVYAGGGHATSSALVVSPLGDIYLTGYETRGKQNKLLVLHFDEARDRLHQVYERPDARGLDIIMDREGQLVIIGTAYTKRTRDDIFVVRLNPEGELLWEEPKIFGGLGIDVGCSILETPDGCYVLAGYSSSYADGARREKMWAHLLNPAGEALWEEPLFWGSPFAERAYGITQIEANSIIAAGLSHSSVSSKRANKSDFWLVSIVIK